MPSSNPSPQQSSQPQPLDEELAGRSAWDLEPKESQRERRDRIHRAVASRLRERIQRLASLPGRNADIASQSAAVAEWLATDQRKVEFMASLWVGRAGLPAAQLRGYVERFSAACADHLRAELNKQGIPFDPHFAIWMVLERSLQRDDAEQRLHAHLLFAMTEVALPHFRRWRGERSRNAKTLWREIVLDMEVWKRSTPSIVVRSCRHDKRGAAGAILYCLKEVGRSSLTELEPALPLAPTDVTAAAETLAPGPHHHQLRRLRRNDYASEADLRAYRSVSCSRGEGSPGPGDLARWRRLRCRLEVPDEWKRVSDRADHK